MTCYSYLKAVVVFNFMMSSCSVLSKCLSTPAPFFFLKVTVCDSPVNLSSWSVLCCMEGRTDVATY